MSESDNSTSLVKSEHAGWLSPPVVVVFAAAVITSLGGLAAAVISNRSSVETLKSVTQTNSVEIGKLVVDTPEIDRRLEASIKDLQDRGANAERELSELKAAMVSMQSKITALAAKPGSVQVESIVNPQLGIDATTEALGMRWYYLGSSVQDGMLSVRLGATSEEATEVMIRATFLPTLVTLTNGQSVSGGRVEFAGSTSGEVGVPFAPATRTDFAIVFPNSKLKSDARVAAVQFSADRRKDRIEGDTTVILSPKP